MGKKLTIFTAAVIGGLAGALTGIFDKIGFFHIPKLSSATSSPIITGTALGIIIGGGIGAAMGLYTPRYGVDNTIRVDNKISGEVLKNINQEANIQIREEQLDIAKKLVKTGEVTVHKEVVKEEKNLIVPVTREELVIEKKVLDTNAPDKADRPVEVFRIPISEERIEVSKRPVILNNVSINKRRLQKTRRIEETLKKEKVYVEIPELLKSKIHSINAHSKRPEP